MKLINKSFEILFIHNPNIFNRYIFWACGVTPQLILEKSKPDFCITHSPGKMLITDKLNKDLAV